MTTAPGEPPPKKIGKPEIHQVRNILYAVMDESCNRSMREIGTRTGIRHEYLKSYVDDMVRDGLLEYVTTERGTAVPRITTRGLEARAMFLRLGEISGLARVQERYERL